MLNDQPWLNKLSRRGWAWEFLRRDPKYRLAFEEASHDPRFFASRGLLYPSDPCFDSNSVDVFWRIEDCPEVLPMAFAREPSLPTGCTLNLDCLSCHIALAADSYVGRRDVLFREQGRFLQLAISQKY